MGRLRSKKFRAHPAAPQSNAGKSKKPQAASSSSSSSSAAAAKAVAAAAVAAAFDGDDDDNAASGDDANDADDGDDANELSGLSRGQRKRMKRRGAFMKKMGMVKRVVEEKEKAKKHQELGAFAEIKALQESLFLSDKELAAIAAGKISQSSNVVAKKTATANAKPKKMSGKQRQKIAVHELGQLKAVHTHPQFQNDPFAAIQMHLQNTVVQANQATLLDQQQKKATAAKAAGKGSKGAKVKGANAMDVE